MTTQKAAQGSNELQRLHSARANVRITPRPGALTILRMIVPVLPANAVVGMIVENPCPLPWRPSAMLNEPDIDTTKVAKAFVSMCFICTA